MLQTHPHMTLVSVDWLHACATADEPPTVTPFVIAHANDTTTTLADGTAVPPPATLAERLAQARAAGMQGGTRTAAALPSVFVSSTFRDLYAERAALRTSLPARVPMNLLDFSFGITDDAPAALLPRLRAAIAGARLVILLLGGRYGTRLPDGLSVTHAEFRMAKEVLPPERIIVARRVGWDVEGEGNNGEGDDARERLLHFHEEVAEYCTAGIVEFTSVPHLLDELVAKVQPHLHCADHDEDERVSATSRVHGAPPVFVTDAHRAHLAESLDAFVVDGRAGARTSLLTGACGVGKTALVHAYAAARRDVAGFRCTVYTVSQGVDRSLAAVTRGLRLTSSTPSDGNETADDSKTGGAEEASPTSLIDLTLDTLALDDGEDKPDPLRARVDEAASSLAATLASIAADQGVVHLLAVDGLDQLDVVKAAVRSDEAASLSSSERVDRLRRALAWLPSPDDIPANCRILLVAAVDADDADLPASAWPSLLLPPCSSGPQRSSQPLLLRSLDETGSHTLVRHHLTMAGKEVSESVWRTLADAQVLREPEYCQTFLSFLGQTAVHDTLGETVSDVLRQATDLPSLYLFVGAQWARAAEANLGDGSDETVRGLVRFLWLATEPVTVADTATWLACEDREVRLLLQLAPSHLVEAHPGDRIALSADRRFRRVVRDGFGLDRSSRAAGDRQLADFWLKAGRPLLALRHALFAHHCAVLEALLQHPDYLHALLVAGHRDTLAGAFGSAAALVSTVEQAAAAVAEGPGVDRLGLARRWVMVLARDAASTVELRAVLRLHESLVRPLSGTLESEASEQVAADRRIIAGVHLRMGAYNEAAGEAGAAVAAAERSGGSYSEQAAHALALAARIAKRAGAYPDAVRAARRAVTILRGHLQDPGLCRAKRTRCTGALATALLVLGDSLRKLGEEGQARVEYEAALTVAGERTTSVVAGELSARLGRLDKAAGDYQAARRRYERARDVAVRRLGPNARRVGDILLLLAQVARKLGTYAVAEAHATEARALLVTHVGAGHADVAEVDLELALIYKKQGRYAEALQVAEAALSTSEATLGVGHERVVAGLMLVGDVLRKLDRFADSRRRYTDALNTVVASSSSSEVERRGEIRQKLGILAKKEAHYDEAATLLQLALVDLQRTRGEGHYKVALAQADLADVARKQHQDQRDLYQAALTTLRQTFGNGHEEVADVLHRLALAEAEFGSRTSAFELLREAMAATEGDTDYRRGSLLADAAYLAGVDGRTRVADDLFNEALALLEAALGGESGEVADALTKRAQVDASLGRARAASTAAQRALSVYRDRLHLDDSHYKVQQALTLAGRT